MKIAYVDGPRLRRSFLAASQYVQDRRAELNRINVFPVPDGDTGSNLALTVQAVSARLEGVRERDVSTVAHQAAEAAVLGARGNCGMMLSQVLLGFAEHLQGRTRVSTVDLAEALSAGARRLQAALENPVEGTILTVVRDTAQAGVRAEAGDVAAFVSELVEEARESLARTPDLLPVLRIAGVVDAGAKGFVSVLEGVLRYMAGDPLSLGEEKRGDETSEGTIARVDLSEMKERFRYCTEALVRGETLPGERQVRNLLREWGDSLVVIRMGNALKVHIHTDEPNTVFQMLGHMGRLITRKAEDLAAQRQVLERAAADGHQLVRRPLGVVTDSACDLPEEVVRAHGIRIVPLELIAGDRTYRDRVDISAEEFARSMESDEVHFTTSQPSPGAFLEGFRDAATDAERLVVVTLGSGLSGTFGSAEVAARMLEDTPVHLMDSQGASLLQGLLVVKAVELAEQGMGPEDVVSELMRIRRQSGVFITVDHYDRLLASGRIGRGMALVGTGLSVKPILSVNSEGKVIRRGQAIGRKRVLSAVIGLLEEVIPNEVDRVRFGVVHVAYPEVVEAASDALRSRWGNVEILAGPATPVIANHVGIGAWGVGYMVED